MIRIKLLSGETVDTVRHTYEQARAAKAAGVGLEVGGPDEDITFVPGDPMPPIRTIYPDGIASIEEMA